MTWGDPHYAGLTGLEIVGKDGDSLLVELSMMDASPRDINELPENGHDLRTLDKYVWQHTLETAVQHFHVSMLARHVFHCP